MHRVCFVVDGFNLYHSLKQAERDGGGHARWLNIRALAEAYLYTIGRDAVLSDIFYFSAIAKHLEATKPGLVERHETYVEALRTTGVNVELSRFKEKDVRCPLCHQHFKRYEEKETDVAVGAKIVELALTASCDTIVVASGDTDVIPAIKTSRRLAHAITIRIAFPYGRVSKQLEKAAHSVMKIRRDQYAKHQLPLEVRTITGVLLKKPAAW